MDQAAPLLETAKDAVNAAQVAAAPFVNKASATYATYAGRVEDLCTANQACTAVLPYVQGAEMDELVLIGLTVVPALFALYAMIGMFIRFIFCCNNKKPGKVAPEKAPAYAPVKKGAPAGNTPSKASAKSRAASAPAPAPTPVKRDSVIARGKKDAPAGSIGHAVRGQAVKNPKAGAYMA